MTTVTSPEKERSKSPQGGVGTALRVKIELWLAVVFMTLAFAAGIVVRGMSEPPAQPAVGVAPVGQGLFAPPLTDAQLRGGLPPGHPSIGPVPGNGTGGAGQGKNAQGNRNAASPSPGSP